MSSHQMDELARIGVGQTVDPTAYGWIDRGPVPPAAPQTYVMSDRATCAECGSPMDCGGCSGERRGVPCPDAWADPEVYA